MDFALDFEQTKIKDSVFPKLGKKTYV